MGLLFIINESFETGSMGNGYRYDLVQKVCTEIFRLEDCMEQTFRIFALLLLQGSTNSHIQPQSFLLLPPHPFCETGFHYVAQASLKLVILPTSHSQVLGL
jgi:hypothetical protein